jgi:phenylpropionate dioxygenase-like ring-hydroxylating dioxygenase large terminal subunit
MESRETLSSEDIGGLVRSDSVHRRVYTDPQVFALEQERIFGRLWIYIAHESQLPNPGSFLRTHLAQYEVLVTRDTDGSVHVLHNRCPHRGARLCMVDQGQARLLHCPYHAWVFRPNGTLATMPHRESYPEAFDVADRKNHLRSVEHVESYRGFIFATLNENPGALREQLGELTEAIDNLIDRAPDGEVEVSESSFTLEYRGNWKLHLENAADIFHPTYVHSSSVGAARRAPVNASKIDNDQTRAMLEANGFGKDQWEGLRLKGFEGGHSYMSNFYQEGVLVHREEDPVATRYKRALVEKTGKAHAERALAVNRFNNIIYPNLILNAQHQQMRVTIPISRDRTIIKAHCFRLKGAPAEMYQRAVRFLSTLASPASMIFSDDVEMLERCQAGLERDDSPWVDFSRGLDSDRIEANGSVTGVASELPMRSQFKAWAEFMSAEGV